MIDHLRTQVQERLDQLLAEADKLRHALTALDPRGNTSSANTKASPPARATSRNERDRPAGSTRSGAAPRPSTTRAPGTAPRGETRSAVLGALRAGNAMTAGEVAAATGLARATISTTLTRLAKRGEVLKAERGYQLATPGRSSEAAAAEG